MAQEAGQGDLLSAERGPWTGGYTSTVPGFMARTDQLIGNEDGSDTNSSRDCFIDPFTGGAYKRSGCAIFQDTLTGGTLNEATGLLNAKWSAKCRKIFALDSQSLTNGHATVAALFGEDTNFGFPTSDVGFNSTIWLASTNSAASTTALKNYSLLEDFDSTNSYSRAASTDLNKHRMKVVPIWMESGDGVYFRGALTGTGNDDPFMQQFVTAGSRSLLQTQEWLYAPNLRCTPWRWNKRFNESGTLPSSNKQIVRIYPTGPFPPLYPPTAAVTNSSGDSTGTSWSDGDTFYLSVIFVREDGSPSAPFIPRQPNATVTGGNGLVTVGTIGGTKKYQSMTYASIPLGPFGTQKRVLLRSVKQNRTATTDNITIAPLDLRVIGALNNNTQTTFVDYGGDDDSLVEDDDFVDVDWTVPRRARHIGTGDSRAIIGYTLPNTAAIMLAPISASHNGASGAEYDLNIADDASTLLSASTRFFIRITATDLELHCQDGASLAAYDTYPTFGAANNAVKFPFSTVTTVEQMVDAINLTLYTYSCKLWKAQLAPGIDPTMPTTSLTKTTFTVSGCSTHSTTTLDGGDFSSVGIGMKVTGVDVAVGTYVVSKTSVSITLSTAATGTHAGPNTYTFWSDTGDTESITNAGPVASYGYIRAFCGPWPVLLHMKPSAFPDYAVPDKQSVYFTNASPGAASSGISLAPNSFTGQNRRLPDPNPRQTHQRTLVGITDIEGAALVAYSDGIFMFANQRGANTGEDFDCRLFVINLTRGCISYLGLTAGNGWAAYPTTEGIIVTDKNRREFSISGDIFNPSDNTGDLPTEVALSTISVAGDTDNQYISCAVVGSKLAVAYRLAGFDPRISYYDFSPGVEASGVEQLLDPDTKRAYVWSPPAVYNQSGMTNFGIGAIGSVRGSSGLITYASWDSNLGSTGDGRIDKINTGTADNGQTLASYAVVPPLIANPFMALQVQSVEATHRTTQSTGSSILAFATDQVPTFVTAVPGLGRTLTTDTTRQYQKQVVPVDQGQRSKTDAFWAVWQSNAVPSGATADRIWRMVFRYTEVEN